MGHPLDPPPPPPPPLSILMKQRNRRAEIVPIIRLRNHPLPIHRHHIRARLRAQPPQPHGLRTIHRDHIDLTALRRQASLIVIVKETVQTPAVHVNVSAGEDAQAPRLPAGIGGAGGESGVVEGGRGGEGGGGDGVGLHVRRLGLDQAHVDVARVGDLVVVQLAVLGAGAVEPDGARVALDQHAAAVVDVDLGVVGAVEIVVRDPEPGVFEVDRARSGDVQHEEGAVAFGVVGRGDGGVFGACVGLEASAGGAPDADVHVPHAG